MCTCIPPESSAASGVVVIVDEDALWCPGDDAGGTDEPRLLLRRLPIGAVMCNRAYASGEVPVKCVLVGGVHTGDGVCMCKQRSRSGVVSKHYTVQHMPVVYGNSARASSKVAAVTAALLDAVRDGADIQRIVVFANDPLLGAPILTAVSRGADVLLYTAAGAAGLLSKLSGFSVPSVGASAPPGNTYAQAVNNVAVRSSLRVADIDSITATPPVAARLGNGTRDGRTITALTSAVAMYQTTSNYPVNAHTVCVVAGCKCHDGIRERARALAGAIFASDSSFNISVTVTYAYRVAPLGGGQDDYYCDFAVDYVSSCGPAGGNSLRGVVAAVVPAYDGYAACEPRFVYSAGGILNGDGGVVVPVGVYAGVAAVHAGTYMPSVSFLFTHDDTLSSIASARVKESTKAEPPRGVLIPRHNSAGMLYMRHHSVTCAMYAHAGATPATADGDGDGDKTAHCVYGDHCKRVLSADGCTFWHSLEELAHIRRLQKNVDMYKTGPCSVFDAPVAHRRKCPFVHSGERVWCARHLAYGNHYTQQCTLARRTHANAAVAKHA